MKSGKHISMILDGVVALWLCYLAGVSSALRGKRLLATGNVDPLQQLSLVDGELVVEMFEGAAMNYEKLMHFFLREHPTLLDLSDVKRSILIDQRRDLVLKRDNMTNKYLKKLFPDVGGNSNAQERTPNTAGLLYGLKLTTALSSLRGLSIEDSEKLLEGVENIATSHEQLVIKYLKKNPKALKLTPKERAHLLDTRDDLVKERVKVSLEYLKNVWNITQDGGEPEPSQDPTTPLPSTTPTICKIIEYNRRAVKG